MIATALATLKRWARSGLTTCAHVILTAATDEDVAAFHARGETVRASGSLDALTQEIAALRGAIETPRALHTPLPRISFSDGYDPTDTLVLPPDPAPQPGPVDPAERLITAADEQAFADMFRSLDKPTPATPSGYAGPAPKASHKGLWSSYTKVPGHAAIGKATHPDGRVRYRVQIYRKNGSFYGEYDSLPDAIAARDQAWRDIPTLDEKKTGTIAGSRTPEQRSERQAQARAARATPAPVYPAPAIAPTPGTDPEPFAIPDIDLFQTRHKLVQKEKYLYWRKGKDGIQLLVDMHRSTLPGGRISQPFPATPEGLVEARALIAATNRDHPPQINGKPAKKDAA